MTLVDARDAGSTAPTSDVVPQKPLDHVHQIVGVCRNGVCDARLVVPAIRAKSLIPRFFSLLNRINSLFGRLGNSLCKVRDNKVLEPWFSIQRSLTATAACIFPSIREGWRGLRLRHGAVMVPARKKTPGSIAEILESRRRRADHDIALRRHLEDREAALDEPARGKAEQPIDPFEPARVEDRLL